MPKATISYDILISCPSDVREYIDSIKRGIERFNSTHGEYRGIILRPKNWQDACFAQSGGNGQELITRQIVKDSDMAIAVFWTKFGEPTAHFASGTEEEIETMISKGKQVFLYFLEKPVPPSMINSRELKKISNFKKKYQDKGIYFTVKDEHELESRVEDGLIRYFS